MSEPAFPQPIETSDDPLARADGLSKREYAAIHILSGMMADGFQPNMVRHGNSKDEDDESYFNYPRAAVQMTDALLAELEKGTHAT